MSIAFSQGKLKGEERKAILQEIQSHIQQIITDGLTLVLEEFLEQEVTTKLARPKRSPRQVSAQTRPIDWQCAHCACNDANQFTRDGHYRRTLETGWGHLDSLQVPMLECQRGPHDVVAHFAIAREIPAFLARCWASSDLWHWIVPQFTPIEPGMGSHLGIKCGITHDQRADQSARSAALSGPSRTNQ